jgi:RNA polymerase-binding protein DksA
MATSKKKVAKKAAKPAVKKPAAKKPAAKKAPAKKAAPAKAKKASPARKAPVKKAAPAKKAPAKKVAPAKKAPPPVKKVRKPPPKMKKMVVKPVQIQVQEELYENASKDFAFAFAESMKGEQLAADERRKTQKATETTVKLSKRPTSRSKDGETLRFPDSDLAQFRKALLALRQTIIGKTATLKTNALEQTIDRPGEDDDGSDSFMRLQNLGQVGEQNKTLQKIDEALHRIDDGTYGICNICGQLIRKARLQHLPFAHTCMECQNEMESNPDSV